MPLKIGELAKRSGLTVRTLHHYDQIGLLSPSGRASNGYRHYSRGDAARLHQIQALKQIGFSLADIGELFAGKGMPVTELIRQQRAMLDQQINNAHNLRDCLALLEDQLAHGAEPSMEEWLSALELMAVHAKYFSADEVLAMRARKRGVDALSEQAWRDFHAEVEALRVVGAPPSDPRALALAHTWIERSDQLAGGDARILQRLGQMQQSEPGLRARSGATLEIVDYLQRACLILDTQVFEKHLTAKELSGLRAALLRHFGAWPMLVWLVREALKQGATPESAELQALAREWHELFIATYGQENNAMAIRMAHILKQEAEWSTENGVDDELLAAILAAQKYINL